jgi:hypothetical protein
MNGITKTIVVGVMTLVLGLAGNYCKNKFSVLSDDLGATKAMAAENARITGELTQKQKEIQEYVDLNIKLVNDKIKLNKKYTDEIARINNEKFDKISLFNKPGTSNVIIHSGMHDLFENISTNGSPSNK